MYILGITYSSHDSSACLIKDGQLLGFIEEERLNREKHTNKPPFNSIDYLLNQESITIDKISYISTGDKGDVKTFGSIFLYALNLKFLAMPFILWQGLLNSLKFFRAKRQLKKRYNYKGKIISIDHHLAHLASAFLVLPFKKSALLSIDGSGECLSSRFALGEKNQIKTFKVIRRPASIGIFLYEGNRVFGIPSYRR
jgi:carbamoyltransferase